VYNGGLHERGRESKDGSVDKKLLGGTSLCDVAQRLKGGREDVKLSG